MSDAVALGAAPRAYGTLEVSCMPVGPIQANCYVVRRAGAAHAIVVDPGGEGATIAASLAELGCTVDAILLTHTHFDHVGGIVDLRAAIAPSGEREPKSCAPIVVGAAESPSTVDLDALPAPFFGPYDGWSDDVQVGDGDQIVYADIAFSVFDAPGHSPGSVVFAADCGDGNTLALSGDVIFAGSIGRTDIPRADSQQLLDSISHLADSLAPSTMLLPGHGPATTLAEQLQRNPFLTSLR